MIWMSCLFAWAVSYAQVVLPDNMVEADCTTEVESMDWGVVNSWSSGTIVSNLNIPLVGDLDGDGHPEVLCFSLSGQSSYSGQGNINSQALVFDGVTHQQKASINLPSPVSAYDAAAYGLVRTSDNKGLIVFACYDNKLRAYDITASNPSTPYWVSDVDYGSGNNDYAVNVSFADFNGDGHPEVYVRNKIYNAESGVLLASAQTSNAGSSYAHYTHVTHRKLSSPVAADLSGNGHPDLILGNQIYQVTLTNTNGTSGNDVTLWKQTDPPASVPIDGHPQVADFNLDGHLDVFISIRTSDMQQGVVYGYVWDVFNETVSTPITIQTSFSGKSIPLIADIDNDGALEMVIQSAVSNSSDKIQAYKYNAASQTFSLMWGMHPDEDSFSNSFTAFDFNQDGLLELIICDQSKLKIVNGSGKSHLTHNDTVPVYVLSQFNFSETTIMQYPVIADVDADGAAEIVSVGSSKLNFFKSSGQPWAPARPVWNQYMYNVTNVNKNLSIPTSIFNNATAFTDPQGVTRRPFNNFLQQATTLDQYGRPFSQMLNVHATTDTNTMNENGTTTLTYKFCNTGGQTLSAPFHITYYADNYLGPIIRTETVNNSLTVDNCLTITAQFTEDDLIDFPYLEAIVVALNDNGTGVAQTGGQQEECDTTDNFFNFLVNPCPIIRDTVTADICVREPYTDENFNIPASETETAGTLYYERVFEVGHCDSVIVLQLRVHPAYDLHFTETIPEGYPYDNHGIFLSESMLEGGDRIDTSIAYQSVYGCDSVIHVTIAVAVSEITLYLPNAITPSRSDGLNDVFYLPEKVQNQIADFEIYIFNRWGELVFYSTDKGFQWNGEYKGKTFHNNVYQYVIHYSNSYGKWFTRKGTITVL